MVLYCGESSNPLYRPTASSEAEWEQGAGEAGACAFSLLDNELFAATEAAAKEHAAAAVALQVQQLQDVVAALQQQLARQAAAAAAALESAQAATAAERRARREEAAAAREALAAMCAQLEAAQRRLAEEQGVLAAARQEAAAARRQLAALTAHLEHLQLMAACDASQAGRQLGLLSRLLSCRSSEAERLLVQLQLQPGGGEAGRGDTRALLPTRGRASGP